MIVKIVSRGRIFKAVPQKLPWDALEPRGPGAFRGGSVLAPRSDPLGSFGELRGALCELVRKVVSSPDLGRWTVLQGGATVQARDFWL